MSGHRISYQRIVRRRSTSFQFRPPVRDVVRELVARGFVIRSGLNAQPGRGGWHSAPRRMLRAPEPTRH